MCDRTKADAGRECRFLPDGAGCRLSGETPHRRRARQAPLARVEGARTLAGKAMPVVARVSLLPADGDGRARILPLPKDRNAAGPPNANDADGQAVMKAIRLAEHQKVLWHGPA